MKHILRFFTLVLLAVLPISLFAQNSTVIIEYMKVPQGMDNDYLQVEQTWKKVHEKRIEAGV